ncbi:ABC transporter substrate-binding protein [Actibacterium lipolyticum]|uniref:Putative siderophore-binding lipoprotein YfiY n=1 Tax=Actibacterium lipolyticum TaxID=1524263 RepID=A0A238LA27_9RHOB|nr:ABC transporter substrate-binding protein [Actibacterium lipolyticum]SMX51222.1 putative siderophore-binding lipoprotein YfiY precursor [Actibacterium lipolyticum]
MKRATGIQAPQAGRASRRGFLGGACATLFAPHVIAAPSQLRFTHAYGETVLAEPARRVVSVGYNTQDTILALGVVPVGIRYWFGNYPFGVWPWAQSYLGGAEPKLMIGEVSMDTVSGLAPDLIIANGSGISKAEYALLSKIAPVLMQGENYSTYGSPWHEDTRRIGRALGKSDLAEDLVAGVKAKFAAAKARHPEWQNKTAAAAWHNTGETGAFMREDTRARFLSELGFVPTKKLDYIAAKDGFYTTLSPEDLSPLDADLLIWISAMDDATDIANLPMRRTLAAHRAGREVFAGQLISGALSFGSVLSLPFALEQLEGDIVAAMDGRPETVVASSAKAGIVP